MDDTACLATALIPIIRNFCDTRSVMHLSQIPMTPSILIGNCCLFAKKKSIRPQIQLFL
jgi:hypothetical protein